MDTIRYKLSRVLLWNAILWSVLLCGCGPANQTETAGDTVTGGGGNTDRTVLATENFQYFSKYIPEIFTTRDTLHPQSSGGNALGSGLGVELGNLEPLISHPENVTWVSYGDSITVQALWQETVNRKMGWKEYSVQGVWGATVANNKGTYWWADEDGAYYNVALEGVDPPENGMIHEGWFCSKDRIEAMIPEDTRLVVFMGGTNDMTFHVPIGSPDTLEDETTLYGGLAAALGRIRERAPETAILVVGPPALHPGENKLGFTVEDYADAMEKVCALENVPYADIYHHSGITLENASEYSDDLIHPNKNGAALIADCIVEALQR